MLLDFRMAFLLFAQTMYNVYYIQQKFEAYSKNVCLTNQPGTHGDIREDLTELRNGRASVDDVRLVKFIIIYSLYKAVHV